MNQLIGYLEDNRKKVEVDANALVDVILDHCYGKTNEEIVMGLIMATVAIVGGTVQNLPFPAKILILTEVDEAFHTIMERAAQVCLQDEQRKN